VNKEILQDEVDTMNLQLLMQSLYDSGDYFISINRGKVDSSNYWQVVKDPDGIIRNRISEEDIYINDVDYIVHYINSLTNGGRILDIGCGFGWLLKSLNDKWEKYGLEPDSNAAKIASQNCFIKNMSFEEDVYPENHFDIINMHHVIEHIDNPLKTMKEIKKILKPNGKLIIATPDFDSGAARLFGSKYRLLHDKTHISLFSNESMHRMLRDFNFKIYKSEFPFFNTRFFSLSNLTSLFDTKKISPPFYGNFMTFFCENKK
jgi:2-polyprenyl-3-methyl-5-hydroxy-6-metoxy-1,4-benzoquinol methylase